MPTTTVSFPRAELAGAAARLMVRDFDDDGLISERELIVDPTQHAERTSEEETVAPTDAQGRHAHLDRPAKRPTPTPAPPIVRRYDRDGDGKLLVVGDGRVGRNESSGRSHPPARCQRRRAARRRRAGRAGSPSRAEIVLPLAFGSGGSAGQAFAAPPGKSSGLRMRKKIDGGFKIYVDDAQIDVNRNNRNPQQNSGLELRFARFDVDKSGYLDEKESRADPLVASAFEGMDADGDGQVVASEFQAYVEIQNASAAARLRLEVIDRGQDLFSVVDANGDGLLTPRELAEAVALVDSEDRNGDGLLIGMEIPARWSLSVARGSSRAGRRPAGPVAGAAQSNWLPARRVRSGFARWTAITTATSAAREYLGTAAGFSAADTSGDGLIDAAEASQLGPPK